MNPILNLFGIKYPIIQAGMIWCSGWKLASAVSNAGGLGLLGAGSMYPDVLRDHIRKCKAATTNPFGVNVPLLYPDIYLIMQIIVEEGVEIVFTSAGNPANWTGFLKEKGIRVVHVVSNIKFARKAEECGVDAIVAEGFEAGGHNGREETTTLCLIPMIRESVKIPLIAAGGIGGGKSMLAAIALGADAVQIGSLFAASEESSAHPDFKNVIINAAEGDTKLSMKSVIPVRLVKNDFFEQVENAEARGATKEELVSLLGRGRAKRGMFEGDLVEGELEIGQVSALIHHIKPAAQILNETWTEFINRREQICKLNF
ncbi:NAD(P)H-dependent flavin oxidoreductase [Daejeonella oryzae]|uniref:NAD(P)H-dependent flavin oxidoreductase n=1 Tax=Daejeonella oryzae TaxID=1122943 RepID=UPI0003FA8379|nr:nitronate monooxygenase [Daejeonella oryzae]